MSQIEVSAARVANDQRLIALVNSKPGIDWKGFFGQLIQGLLPMLLGCLGASTTKSYVESHYDEATNEYEPTLLNRTKFQVRRKARREHQLHLDNIETTYAALAVLDEARTMSDGEVASLMAGS